MNALEGKKEYRSILGTMTRLTKEEGLMSLWRGNVTNVIRYFPQQSFNFAFKEQFKRLSVVLFGKADPKKDFKKFFISNVMAGGLAGAGGQIFVYPLDLARTRLALSMGKTESEREFTGLMDCLKKLYRSDGVIGLYRGLWVSTICYFFYRAVYFGFYDTYKVRGGANANIFTKFMVANVIVAIAATSTYPLDTVRRRLMLQSGKPANAVQYKGTAHTFKKMYREEGMAGFYKGCLSNIFRGIGGSLVLVVFDELRLLIDPNSKPTAE